MKHAIVSAAVLSVLLASSWAQAAEGPKALVLENKLLRVEFDQSGLSRIHDKALDRSIDFKGDRFIIKIDDITVDSKTTKL
ncbi:MAG: hypothetical protein QGG25_03200, partial [Phycisphaerae bacterium]|nr:hypothetical protein [Phycisphaerae bacterium]